MYMSLQSHSNVHISVFTEHPYMPRHYSSLFSPLDSMFRSGEGSSSSMPLSLRLPDLSSHCSLLRAGGGGVFLHISPSQLPTVILNSVETSLSLESFVQDDSICPWHGEEKCGCKATRGSGICISYSFPKPCS